MGNLTTKYETVEIELIPVCSSDIITASGAFDGEDDNVSDWSRKK